MAFQVFLAILACQDLVATLVFLVIPAFQDSVVILDYQAFQDIVVILVTAVFQVSQVILVLEFLDSLAIQD